MVTVSGQSQQLPKLYALCTTIGRQCPNNYLLPIHPEWSDPEEEEKDLNEQEEKENKKKFGMVQLKNRRKKKNSNKVRRNFSKSDPEAMFPLETEDVEVHTPQLTDTLIGKALEQEEQKNNLCDSDNSEFFVDNSDDTLDKIVYRHNV